MAIKTKIICVDARMINNSGIGVYIRYFTQALIEDIRFDVILLGRSSELKTFFNTDHFRLIEANFPIYSVIEQLKLPFLIPVCDLFWSPHYNIPILPTRAKKYLVTIPDVYHLAFAHTLSLPKRVYANVIMNIAVWKASSIITISNFSKQEIGKYLKVDDKKISTIYLGIDEYLFRDLKHNSTIANQIRIKYNMPDRFILFVGNVKPNKNLKSLVHAFMVASKEVSDLNLLIVGKKDGFIGGDPTLFSQIASDPIVAQKVLFTGYVHSEHLPYVYNMADVFVFPSIYEGFGFPPLEAMACGTPVVASDQACIPEICEKAALYANPTDIKALSRKIVQACTDLEVRKMLIENGAHHVKKFTWQRANSEFIKVIDKLF